MDRHAQFGYVYILWVIIRKDRTCETAEKASLNIPLAKTRRCSQHAIIICNTK